MSRTELSREAAAELAALDAILAGAPVDDRHLELAALVDSVRKVSPALDEAGRERIDARLSTVWRKPADRRIRSRGRPERPAGARQSAGLRPARLALAGGPFIAVVVAVAVVFGGGVFGRSKPAPTVSAGPAHGVPATLPTPSAAGQGNSAGRTDLSTNSGAIGATTALGAPAVAQRAGAPAPTTDYTATNVSPRNRLVAQGASLTLASSPDQMQTVANEVVSNTERLGGIVENSNVSVHGSSSYASFNLSVPRTRLAQLISSLSSLTAVRSLDQSANDITDNYDKASALLADEKAQRVALIKSLAAAVTLSDEEAIQKKITRLDRAIAASAHAVGSLLSRGHNSHVSVQVLAAAAGAAGGGGPVDRALNDAVKVLDVALAIALVALAIALPIGLVGLLFFWASASLRRRSREQALAASASS